MPIVEVKAVYVKCTYCEKEMSIKDVQHIYISHDDDPIIHVHTKCPFCEKTSTMIFTEKFN